MLYWNLDRQCKAGSSQCLGPPVIPDMGNDFGRDLIGYENYCPIRAGGLPIWGDSSLSSFPPAHLLLTGSSPHTPVLDSLYPSQYQPQGQKYSRRDGEEKVFRLIPLLYSLRNRAPCITLQIGPKSWTHHEYQVIFSFCPDCVAVLTSAVRHRNLDDTNKWINFE